MGTATDSPGGCAKTGASRCTGADSALSALATASVVASVVWVAVATAVVTTVAGLAVPADGGSVELVCCCGGADACVATAVTTITERLDPGALLLLPVQWWE